jgi:ABC-type transport system involved in multi-copper enzyme maturation permease subunit
MTRGLVAWWHLTKESFLILQRDRIFLPIIIVGTVIGVFANLASNWTFEGWEKILFDVGLAGFRLTGGLVAILWGVRMITDPLQDRSIELRIAAPSARYSWILARYAGLAFCLIVMGAIFIGIWQGLMVMNGYGTMNNLQSWTMGLVMCEWLVLGALGLLLGTIASFSTAMFVTLTAWILGLVAPIVAATTGPETDPLQRKLIELTASVWNFQRFNMIDKLEAGQVTVALQELTQRLTWGGSVLAGCLVLSAWVFSKKDLT